MSRKHAFPADRLFFPLAAAFGMLVIPIWLAALNGWVRAPGAYWHAHEMLFGYALLVVAGYLVGRASRGVMALLTGAWLAARVMPWITGEGSLAAAGPELIFSFTVAALTAWPFLRAAKKLQNRVFAPLFIALFVCDAAYQAGAARASAAIELTALLSALDLYALLLVLMGGRVIPAAIAGHFYRQGRILKDRVQPALEKAVIALMSGMLVFDLFPNARCWAGACAIGAAIVTAVRASRWRLWSVLDQPHLWPLGLGYLWLVPGLALKGYAEWSASPMLGDAVHALTIGALGTLTLVMMARTHLQRGKRPLARFGDVAAAALLLSLSTVARLANAVAPAGTMSLLWASGTMWTLAFGLLLRWLLVDATTQRLGPN